MRERWHGLFWGLLLIVLGISFYLSMQGWGGWWQFFLIGLGVIFLVESRVRGGTGRIIAGLVLIAVGAVLLTGWGDWWPLILIVAGLAIIFNSWRRR